MRSGKYRQTKNALHDNEGWCCLGVACDVAGFEASGNTLPEEAIDAFGFKDSLGMFDGRDWGGKHSLAVINDAGRTFKEIADFVETNPERVWNDNKP